MRKNYRATHKRAQAKDHNTNSAPNAARQWSPDYYRFRDRWRRAITISHRLSAADKLVALVLLEHVSREHWNSWRRLECWPSQNRIGTLIHRASRNVLGTLHRLVAQGMIAVVRPGNPVSHESARYRFEEDWLRDTEAEAVEAVEKWPDRRLNRSPDETKSELVMEPSAKPSDESLDPPVDQPARATARGGGKGSDRRRMRRKGRAAAALDDALADLAAVEEEEATAHA